MSLANIKGKLSRAEMKNIMAGSGDAACGSSCSGSCELSGGGSGNCYKPSSGPNAGKCFCNGVR